jgi:hypothetical protein
MGNSAFEEVNATKHTKYDNPNDTSFDRRGVA